MAVKSRFALGTRAPKGLGAARTAAVHRAVAKQILMPGRNDSRLPANARRVKAAAGRAQPYPVDLSDALAVQRPAFRPGCFGPLRLAVRRRRPCR